MLDSFVSIVSVTRPPCFTLPSSRLTPLLTFVSLLSESLSPLSLSLFLSQSFILSLALPFYIFPSTSSRLPKPDDAKRNGWTSDDQRSIRLIAIRKICRSGAMWIWQSDKFNSWHPFASTQVLARRNIIFSYFSFAVVSFFFFFLFFRSFVSFAFAG